MKKILTFVYCLLSIASTTLVGCKSDKDEVEQTNKSLRTVLIYIAGENNLSSYAPIQLNQIKIGSNNLGQNNLLVYVDQAKPKELPYLAKVANGQLVDSVSIADMKISSSDVYSGDPKVMKEVLKYAFEHYPAENNDYGLVLWGHADGWMIERDSIVYSGNARKLAYGGDTGNNIAGATMKRWLNIPTMKTVINSLGYPLTFIFADCCNFMCLESLYELKECAKYIIGSPAEIPGCGAPYEKVVPAMFSRNADFYKQIVDAYYAQTVDGQKCPLTAVQSSGMPAVAEATSNLLQAIVSNIPGWDAAALENHYLDMKNRVYYYDTDKCAMYDAQDFLKSYSTMYALEGEFNEWKKAVDNAIVYRKYAERWVTNYHVIFSEFTNSEENTCGLSMFVPQASNTQLNMLISYMGWYYAAGYNKIGW